MQGGRKQYIKSLYYPKQKIESIEDEAASEMTKFNEWQPHGTKQAREFIASILAWTPLFFLFMFAPLS